MSRRADGNAATDRADEFRRITYDLCRAARALSDATADTGSRIVHSPTWRDLADAYQRMVAVLAQYAPPEYRALVAEPVPVPPAVPKPEPSTVDGVWCTCTTTHAKTCTAARAMQVGA